MGVLDLAHQSFETSDNQPVQMAICLCRLSQSAPSAPTQNTGPTFTAMPSMTSGEPPKDGPLGGASGQAPRSGASQTIRAKQPKLGWHHQITDVAPENVPPAPLVLLAAASAASWLGSWLSALSATQPLAEFAPEFCM
jgi:hypothetical protein